MSVLNILWIAALALSAISILLVLALVLGRVLGHGHNRRRMARKEQLLKLTLKHIEGAEFPNPPSMKAGDADAALVHDIVIKLLRIVSGDHRSRLVSLLERVGVKEHLIGQLESRKRNTRLTAASELSYFHDERVIAALTAALDDPDRAVRLAVASALINLDAAPNLLELIDRLKIGATERSRALRKMFRRMIPGQTEQLIRLLERDRSEPVKLLSLDALGRSGDFGVIDAVIQATRDPTLNVRAEAFRALSNLNHPSALPAVETGLQDRCWEVLAQAAVCAGRINALDVMPKLTTLLEDPEWWVQFRAAEALFAFGPRGIGILHHSARQSTSAGRAARELLEEKEWAA